MLSQTAEASPAAAVHRAGVLGSPIGHSLSPVLHNAAYRALGLDDWHYESAEVDAVHFVGHVRALDASWRGLSLTRPLKSLGFDVASSVSPLARATGVVNTLVRAGEGWHGDNTDVHGIAAALGEAGVREASSALVVGSGATARSAVAALAQLGATRVTFMVRGEPRAETVAHAHAAGFAVEDTPFGIWPAHVELVVSTVPPAATAVLAESLPAGGSALLDVVYADGRSALMDAAARRGYAVVDGTVMLLHQAAAQVRLMTGEEPPLEAMRTALAARRTS